MLEAHDPGRRNADVARMFGELETVLPGIVDQVRGGPKPAGPTGKKPKLKRVARRMMTMIGLPATHARLDISSHPFTAGEPEGHSHYDPLLRSPRAKR